MVEVEGHGHLVVGRVGVANAVLQRGGAHLAHGHVSVNAAKAHELLQVFVHMRPVRVEVLAVGLVTWPAGGLRDEVHDVKAEARDALVLPESQHVRHLLAYLGVVPVEVGLRDVEEVQVPLVQAGHVLPGVAAKLAVPVGGRLSGVVRRSIGCRVDELVVREVLRVSSECALEPLVRGRGVVEDHVEHDLQTACLCLASQLVKVLHGAKDGLDGAVVRHVVAVVILRAHEERRDPYDVDAKIGKVIQL